VGRGKSFVQVEVHDIDAEISRAGFADEGVHVGAIHVEETAFGMHEFGDLVDLLLEDAERVGIGKHERGHVFVHLRSERGYIDHAPVVGC